MAGSRIFDGSSYYVENNLGSDYASLTTMSICGWVYRATSGVKSIPWGIGPSSANRVDFYWWSDNKLYLVIDNFYNTNASTDTSTGWHHMAGVWDASQPTADKCVVYVDGIRATGSTFGTPPSTTNSGLSSYYAHIGRAPSMSSNETSGNALAHVSVYNSALTQKEVCELMIKPASPQRGRLHYWPLNGNDTSATNVEYDEQRVHNITGSSMSSTCASALSPRICIGATPQCHW